MSPIEFRMIRLTVTYDIMQRCCERATPIVLIINKTCEEYHCCLTDGTDETKLFLFAVSHTIRYRSIRETENSHQMFCQNLRGEFLVSKRVSYGKDYSGSGHTAKMLRNDNYNSTNVEYGL